MGKYLVYAIGGILLLLIVFSLMSCARKHTPEDYKSEVRNHYLDAVKECSTKNKVYVHHYTNDLKQWRVICYHTDPLEFFHYDIE